MAEFIEVLKKSSNVQNEISQIIEKCKNKSYAKQSKIGQNALIQSKVFEQAMKLMGDTIEGEAIEVEQKDRR